MEQAFLFTVFWKDEMYIGDISDIIQFQQQKRFNSFLSDSAY